MDNVELSIPEQIEKFRELRDEKAELGRAYREADANLKAKMEIIESWLLQKSRELGVKSFPTANGTAFTTTSRKFSVQPDDWDKFSAWMRDNDLLHFVKREVKKTAVTEYEEEHGELPPFINEFSEEIIQIRKS